MTPEVTTPNTQPAKPVVDGPTTGAKKRQTPVVKFPLRFHCAITSATQVVTTAWWWRPGLAAGDREAAHTLACAHGCTRPQSDAANRPRSLQLFQARRL